MTVQTTTKVGSLTPELLDLIFTIAPSMIVEHGSGMFKNNPNAEEIAKLASILVGSHVSVDDLIKLAEEIEMADSIGPDVPTAAEDEEDKRIHHRVLGFAGDNYGDNELATHG